MDQELLHVVYFADQGVESYQGFVSQEGQVVTLGLVDEELASVFEDVGFLLK